MDGKQPTPPSTPPTDRGDTGCSQGEESSSRVLLVSDVANKPTQHTPPVCQQQDESSQPFSCLGGEAAGLVPYPADMYMTQDLTPAPTPVRKSCLRAAETRVGGSEPERTKPNVTFDINTDVFIFGAKYPKRKYGELRPCLDGIPGATATPTADVPTPGSTYGIFRRRPGFLNEPRSRWTTTDVRELLAQVNALEAHTAGVGGLPIVEVQRWARVAKRLGAPVDKRHLYMMACKNNFLASLHTYRNSSPDDDGKPTRGNALTYSDSMVTLLRKLSSEYRSGFRVRGSEVSSSTSSSA